MSECSNYQIDLAAVLDGEASEEETATALLHLNGCPACGDYLRRTVGVKRSLKTWTAPNPNLNMPDLPKQHPWWQNLTAPFRRPILAMAIVLSLFFAVLLKPAPPQPKLETYAVNNHHQVFVLGEALAGMKAKLP